MKKFDKDNIITRFRSQLAKTWTFCSDGIWHTADNSIWIKILKTLNLSVKSFLNVKLQLKSQALTYNTVLAIVPTLALLFAIVRGFGFQDLLLNELYKNFPAQHQAISTALIFVDSYLSQASKGIFVGIGLVFLLWTLISLLSNIEAAFNSIWGLKTHRSLYRKITDYTSICLMIPILMICSSGINIYMSSALQDGLGLGLDFLSPILNILLDATPFILNCLAFTLSFLLIPNTKVQFKYAAISGFICGISFQILQLLFVNGQIYVSKYNAIYGSFAFLPLLLIWLQLSWLILLFGCLLTYSSQNIFKFNFAADISDISKKYMENLTIALTSIVIHRFLQREKVLTVNELAHIYNLPVRLVSIISNRLHSAGIFYYVMLDNDKTGIAPAVDSEIFTVGELMRRIDIEGKNDFIPHFNEKYCQFIDIINSLRDYTYNQADKVLVRDLPLFSGTLNVHDQQ